MSRQPSPASGPGGKEGGNPPGINENVRYKNSSAVGVPWRVVYRLTVNTPVWVWKLLLEKKYVPVDVVKLAGWGLASRDSGFVEKIANSATEYERLYSDIDPIVAAAAAEDLRNIIVHVARVGGAVFEGDALGVQCLKHLLHSMALEFLYAVARVHNVKPVVQEGEYKGYKYIAVALGDAGLPEVTKALEELIDEACKTEGACP